MLVKIIAVGLEHALWKNIFHHLRTLQPQATFSAGIFCSDDEIAYLENEYFPGQWWQERPDLILTDSGGSSGKWDERLEFLRRVEALELEQPATTVLALHSLAPGLKQLVQGRQLLKLHLDNQARFSLTDPNLLIDSFPENFPRLRLDPYIKALKIPGKGGRSRQIAPQDLPVESLLGLSQIESISMGEEMLSPQEWLKSITRTEKIRWPIEKAAAIYRESDGVYLFPGVPTNRVRGVTVGGIKFAPLIDLGILTAAEPGFGTLGKLIAKSYREHNQTIEKLTVHTRDAESRTDLPIRCGGGVAILNDIMAHVLTDGGYLRVAAEPITESAQNEEPELRFILSSGAQDLPPMPEQPIVLDIQYELTPHWAELEGFTDWQELIWRSSEASEESYGSAVASVGAFREARGRLMARAEKSRAGLDFAERRILLVSQEVQVLSSAIKNIETLLSPIVEIWSGEPPEKATQALVLSFDEEEAGHVLVTLPKIDKKRWFDLAPCRNADETHNLQMEPIKRYSAEGKVFITPAAHERLKESQSIFQTESVQAKERVEEAQTASEEYRTELEKVEEAQNQLAKAWMKQVLEQWVLTNESRLLETLTIFRARHEWDWLNRGQINRVVILSANGENRKTLVEACRNVYPHFNPELSLIVPFDLEIQEALTPEERREVIASEKKKESSGSEIKKTIAKTLEEINHQNLDDYLKVVGLEIEKVSRVDLLVIENRPEIAEKILNAMRSISPTLGEAPAVLILPDNWNPAAGEALAWPRTRTVVIRRMGTLTMPICVEKMRDLHPM